MKKISKCFSPSLVLRGYLSHYQGTTNYLLLTTGAGFGLKAAFESRSFDLLGGF